jgi:hypothetical protein
MVWLAEDVIMLLNAKLHSLDIYRISSPEDTDSKPRVTLVCQLGLPRLGDDAHVASITYRAEPNFFLSGSPPGTHNRPFYDPPETAILYMCMDIQDLTDGASFSLSMITHRSSLLSFIPPESQARDGYKEEEEQQALLTLYEAWGIQSTCWFWTTSNWVTTSAGQRYAFLTSTQEFDEENVVFTVHVLDFNTRRVRAAQAAIIEKGDRDESGEVSHEPRLVHGRRTLSSSGVNDLFAGGGFEFELPYVEQLLHLPKGGMYADAWLDDQRVVAVKVRLFSTHNLPMT